MLVYDMSALRATVQPMLSISAYASAVSAGKDFLGGYHPRCRSLRTLASTLFERTVQRNPLEVVFMAKI